MQGLQYFAIGRANYKFVFVCVRSVQFRSIGRGLPYFYLSMKFLNNGGGSAVVVNIVLHERMLVEGRLPVFGDKSGAFHLCSLNKNVWPLQFGEGFFGSICGSPCGSQRILADLPSSLHLLKIFPDKYDTSGSQRNGYESANGDGESPYDHLPLRKEIIIVALVIVSGVLCIGYAFYSLGKITERAGFICLTIGITLYMGGALICAVLIGPL